MRVLRSLNGSPQFMTGFLLLASVFPEVSLAQGRGWPGTGINPQRRFVRPIPKRVVPPPSAQGQIPQFLGTFYPTRMVWVGGGTSPFGMYGENTSMALYGPLSVFAPPSEVSGTSDLPDYYRGVRGAQNRWGRGAWGRSDFSNPASVPGTILIPDIVPAPPHLLNPSSDATGSRP